MTPEDRARINIDKRLIQAGWVVQDMDELDPTASLGVATREFPTSTGEVDYALFVDGIPVGVIEAKKDDAGHHLTTAEVQSKRYANSKLLYIRVPYRIRFAYEATGELTRFTDYDDIKCCSRPVFSFHRPETLYEWMKQSDTLRNSLKKFPPLNPAGFRTCQVSAIENLDQSFADNRPRALIQMATGAGKTFTAITAAYRLLKYGHMKRILFLVDTKSLGIQAEQEFRAYQPNDDPRLFADQYIVQRLRKSSIPENIHICISTIQRMYSILSGEELDESAEEESMFENTSADSQKQREVVYNPSYPPEFFDCIIIDECHRSIYNVWGQVLEYFDAFLIGLTATPDQRTFAFFKENVVSEYTRDQAITDHVNVGEEVFLIETEITKNGAFIMKQQIEFRDRLTRARRWKLMDDDLDYAPIRLDKDIVNPSQIRTIIRSFRDNLFTQLFPHRTHVPKTLIFAKTDSHAEDIVTIVREEFGEGNDFCRKITSKPERRADGKEPDKPETILSMFRKDYYPRIAVTVDMIATGTDVKPIECLIFMRDVRSRNYFEQMKGRGTRTLDKEDLKKVTPDATENKDHFVIVDAVGVTKSVKSDTIPLERLPYVNLHTLLMNVATGSRDEDTLTSLANRVIRLNAKMTAKERKEFTETVGKSAGELAKNLLDAFDPDVIAAKAGVTLNADTEPTEEENRRMETAQKELAREAARPFCNPKVRNYIEDLHRLHEQLIDDVNLDAVLYAGYDQDRQGNAERMIRSFHDFIEEHRDEILALRILYDQRYKDRPMAIDGMKKLYAALKEKGMTKERLWDSYAFLQPEKVKRRTMVQLADLVSMIRFEMGAADHLTPFADRVDYNFKQWTFRRNAGPVHFTDEQMEWLRLIKDHIAASLSITPEDLDLSPFDRRGGLGRFYEVFGEQYEDVLQEMNLELVA